MDSAVGGEEAVQHKKCRRQKVFLRKQRYTGVVLGAGRHRYSEPKK